MTDETSPALSSSGSSLAAQMMLALAALALLSALAVGLPAIWLVRNQLQSQAWAQVQQGLQASRALYDAQQNELAGLATLTAQRPTLAALLRRGRRRRAAGLPGYAARGRRSRPDCGLWRRWRAARPGGSGTALPCCRPCATCRWAPDVLTTQPSGVLPQVWLAAAQRLASRARGCAGRGRGRSLAGQGARRRRCASRPASTRPCWQAACRWQAAWHGDAARVAHGRARRTRPAE